MTFGRHPRARRLLARLSGRRRGACARAMEPPRCFALELPGCTLAHFAVGELAPGARPDPRVAALLGPPGRSYSLSVPETGGVGARVRAARLHQHLRQQLRRGPFQRCELRRLLGYRPDGGAGALQHGFLLRDPRDSPDTRQALLELLDACPEAPRPLLAEFSGDRLCQLWQRPWERRDGRGWRQLGGERVGPAPEPALHPVVPDLPSAGVFPHREAACAVLEAVRSQVPSQRSGTPQSRDVEAVGFPGAGGGVVLACPDVFCLLTPVSKSGGEGGLCVSRCLDPGLFPDSCPPGPPTPHGRLTSQQERWGAPGGEGRGRWVCARAVPSQKQLSGSGRLECGEEGLSLGVG